MKKITLFLALFMFSAYTYAQDVLCIDNQSWDRKSFVIYFNDEPVQVVSIGSGNSWCFETGRFEDPWRWSVSIYGDSWIRTFADKTVTFY